MLLVGQEFFLFSTTSRPALRSTQPLVQLAPGLFPQEVKRPGCEADYSPPSSAKVKNGGAIPLFTLVLTPLPLLFTFLDLPVFSRRCNGF
jgi:hypothetical protein